MKSHRGLGMRWPGDYRRPMWGARSTTCGAGFPQDWAAALRGCGHIVAMNSAEVGAFLARLAAGLDEAQAGDRASAVSVGEQLVRAYFVDDEVLGRSIAAIHTHCAAEHADAGDRSAAGGVAGCLEGFTTGYVKAFREWVLAEQESLRAADVAARRVAEQQLRSSEARLRAVFAQAGVGTGISDMTGRIVEVNPAFANMLGYGVEEFCDRFAVTDLTHPDDDPAVWQRYGELIRGRPRLPAHGEGLLASRRQHGVDEPQRVADP